jgi:hypothetical protein
VAEEMSFEEWSKWFMELEGIPEILKKRDIHA